MKFDCHIKKSTPYGNGLVILDNNISENETITILQIEIDKLNENEITNQVEYEIYTRLYAINS